MPLEQGHLLGHYKVRSIIGQGGMGEVYRAVDMKLEREVALKILPAAFASDPDRMARFEREARALAALNHSNIAQIYGVEERALVMELVEGEALKGPLPLEFALKYALQIAEALEAAHEKGIVHRDLKPANVKITPEGAVKVLDFGLAMAVDDPAPPADTRTSPTLTMRATQAGVILGTAAYMAPEQARGHAVDRRADVWSFGAVLYEMLAGKPPFDGESITDILAAVVKLEPDWSALPASTPAPVLNLMKRCLTKDRRQRLQAIGEARIAIEYYRKAPNEPAKPEPVGRPNRVPWFASIAILSLAALGFGYISYRHATEQPPTLRLSILPPPKVSADMEAISPDGRRIVFVGTQETQTALWVRDLDSLSARRLEATEDPTYPFWSPDSRSIAFFQGGRLKRIDAAGGPAVTLCEASNGRSGSWNQNGVILFSPSVGTGIYQVPAAGGRATPVTEPDRASGENAHRMPWFLPDGHRFLYTARNTDPENTAIYVADINSTQRRKILSASYHPMYAPPGLVLFLRGTTLMAQPFDPSSAQIKGEPLTIAEQVRLDSLNLTGRFSVSQTGVLAYTSSVASVAHTETYSGGPGTVQLTWYDRSGKFVGTIGDPGVIDRPSISPDGHAIAFDRVSLNGKYDVWLYDRSRGTESRFTFSASQNEYPTWSPDGTRIVFFCVRPGLPGALFQKSVSGSGQGEPLDQSMNARPEDWSRDGRYIVGRVLDPQTSLDLWVFPQFGDRKPFPFLRTQFNEEFARLSPNGRWIAYQSDETRRPEVYVQAFPGPGGKWQISTNGGFRPVWSRDGKELFFLDSGGRMMAVNIDSGEKFQAGFPRVLFQTKFMLRGLKLFDVGNDGGFIVPNRAEDDSPEPITVVINWTAGLKK